MSNSTEKFQLADAIGTMTRSRAGVSPDGQPEVFTILLVDDDPDCRALIREAIGECGSPHLVIEMPDGQAAIDYLKQKANSSTRPGLIFLDVEMPRLNGLQTLEAIKSHEKLRDIPVVMMTGVADDDYIRQAAALGANSYTIKPANPEHFLRTVMTSTQYWLTVHQYPGRHLPASEARR